MKADFDLGSSDLSDNDEGLKNKKLKTKKSSKFHSEHQLTSSITSTESILDDENGVNFEDKEEGGPEAFHFGLHSVIEEEEEDFLEGEENFEQGEEEEKFQFGIKKPVPLPVNADNVKDNVSYGGNEESLEVTRRNEIFKQIFDNSEEEKEYPTRSD